MDAREALKSSIDMGKMVSMAYISDCSTDELMQRPHADANHVIWQLGHLIASEHGMMEGCLPGSMPALPDGFADAYSKETTKNDDASVFHSKEELLEVFESQRAGTLANLDKLSDEELDQPAPESMRSYAPTVGAAISMQGAHWLMHCGQWAVLRRELGKPIVI